MMFLTELGWLVHGSAIPGLVVLWPILLPGWACCYLKWGAGGSCFYLPGPGGPVAVWFGSVTHGFTLPWLVVNVTIWSGLVGHVATLHILVAHGSTCPGLVAHVATAALGLWLMVFAWHGLVCPRHLPGLVIILLPGLAWWIIVLPGLAWWSYYYLALPGGS